MSTRLSAGAAEACVEGGDHDGWTRITFSQNTELGTIISSAEAIEVVRINTKGEMLFDDVRFFIPHKYLQAVQCRLALGHYSMGPAESVEPKEAEWIRMRMGQRQAIIAGQVQRQAAIVQQASPGGAVQGPNVPVTGRSEQPNARSTQARAALMQLEKLNKEEAHLLRQKHRLQMGTGLEHSMEVNAKEKMLGTLMKEKEMLNQMKGDVLLEGRRAVGEIDQLAYKGQRLSEMNIAIYDTLHAAVEDPSQTWRLREHYTGHAYSAAEEARVYADLYAGCLVFPGTAGEGYANPHLADLVASTLPKPLSPRQGAAPAEGLQRTGPGCAAATGVASPSAAPFA